MLRPIQAIAFALLLDPSAAKAEVQRRFVLDYRAAVSCPSEGELLSEVRRRSPHAERVTRASTHEAQVRLRVESDGERQRGSIDVDTSEGTTHREIEGSECAEVVRALALILAIAIDPDGSAGEPQGSRASEPAKAPPARPTLPPRTRQIWWAAGVSLGFVGGVAPNPALSEGLLVQVGRGREPGFSANLRLAGFHAHGAAVAHGGTANFDLLSLRLASCPYRVGARPMLSGCVSFDWGRLHGTGSKTVAARSSSTPWLGPGAFVDAAFQALPHLYLQLELGALLPLSRDSFYFGPDETVHRIPTLVGYGGLNVSVSG